MTLTMPQQPRPDKLRQIVEFYKAGALYSAITLEWSTNAEGAQILNALHIPRFTIDAYCPACGEASTFSHHRTLMPPNVHLMQPEPFGFLVTMRCARSDAHLRQYAFEKRNNLVVKAGEYPSAYETSQAQINGYKKVLTASQLTDLKLAIVGHSHGIGAGSLIYLRRLFEGLVEGAHIEAQADPAWNESDYTNIRMKDKIQLLARWLPEYLVENKLIYSIMSAGVHKLTEDQCKAMFPVIEAGIILILEQHLATKRRADLAKATSADLQTLHSLIESDSLSDTE